MITAAIFDAGLADLAVLQQKPQMLGASANGNGEVVKWGFTHSSRSEEFNC